MTTSKNHWRILLGELEFWASKMKQFYYVCDECGEIWKEPDTILALRILERDGFTLWCSKDNCTGKAVERVAEYPG